MYCILIHVDTVCDSAVFISIIGAFASQYLFSEDFLSKERRSKPPKGRKKPTDAQIKIKELVRFFMEANIHEHTIYLVDSLWDHTDVLQVCIYDIVHVVRAITTVPLCWTVSHIKHTQLDYLKIGN